MSSVAITYTIEEQQLAMSSLLRLTNPQILEFFRIYGLKRANNKAEMRVRLSDALEDGAITYNDIFKFLTPIETWGKQHVFLLNGPPDLAAQWSSAEWVESHIAVSGFEGLIDAELPLALPQELTLSTVQFKDNKIRIVSVVRREGEVRDAELDTLSDDESVFYKAYRYLVYRGFVILEWDITANHATLHISQLPSGGDYEDAKGQFASLIAPLLPLDGFQSLCLRTVITKLHELEERGIPEARSQGLAYKTGTGRTVEGRGASGSDGLFGESVVDTTMANVRKVSVGHTGNFYWLPADVNVLSDNPLTSDLHISIIGQWSRVNFHVYSPEPQVRYVLQRIRSIATSPSNPQTSN